MFHYVIYVKVFACRHLADSLEAMSESESGSEADDIDLCFGILYAFYNVFNIIAI